MPLHVVEDVGIEPDPQEHFVLRIDCLRNPASVIEKFAADGCTVIADPDGIHVHIYRGAYLACD